ncbi:hypothetical protein ZTR_11389 [Talaromyces verruculosus]|nr:hypothetical protein ZTR_11389 [Talaromyces verruculosus]
MAEGAVASPLAAKISFRKMFATRPHQNNNNNTKSTHHTKKNYNNVSNRGGGHHPPRPRQPSSHLSNESFLKAFAKQIKHFTSSQGERHERDPYNNREQTAKSVTMGMSTDSANTWKAHQAQVWQAAIQSAVSPQSQSAGSSTPGVSHAELGMDCEILVKIRDDLDRRKSTPSLPPAGYAFTAARQLPSGDISLRAQTAAGAEVLRKHGESWVHTFGKSAYVRVPTWGIVIDGMPAKFVDMSEEFKRELIAANTNWGQEGFEIEIAHVGWLVQPKGYSGSLIVEFTTPVVANNALRGGTVWHSHSLTNRPYCKERRVKMCKKCQKYGHVHAQCPDQKFHCGLCAEEHPTWECSSKQSRDLTLKCVNCNGCHKISSDSCPVRQKETTRARHAVLVNQNIREHRVPQYLQARMMQQNIEPTPREAAKITTAKRQQPQPQKKAPTKAVTTTKAKGKKTQQGAKNAPESASAPEPAPESTSAPALEPAPKQASKQAPELACEQDPEPIREQEPGLDPEP